MVVMVDEETGEKYARGVTQKGIGEDGEMKWLIDDMQRELKSWGHPGGDNSHMIFKSDGEASIKVVRDKLARQMGGNVVTESPAQGESQSNGFVEEAGKTVINVVRVFKDVIETKIRATIKSKDALLMWVIRWAAMVTSRYLVGKGGMTAQERKRGRRCRTPVASFG